jgi:hypothetical protein
MGGNATGVLKRTGQTTIAKKVDLLKANRVQFITTFSNVFKEINRMYKKRFKQDIWDNLEDLKSPKLYNGSTSYIFDTSIPDEELLKYKKSAGDIDLMVPEEHKDNLWHLLDSIEGLEIIKGVTYMGNNKPTVTSIGDQINAVFIAEFEDYKASVQVDFEFLEFCSDGSCRVPTEWAKFSHSSTFEDAKNEIKALHHKYLIQAIVGSASARPDIAIVTSKSTWDNFKISQAKGLEIPRMLKFSVGRGIRTAYEPLKDLDGNVVVSDGKKLYKEIPTETSDYVTTIKEIYTLTMGDPEAHPEDIKRFWSFVGVLELMKKYFKDPKTIQETFDRYTDLLFATKGRPGQVIEVGNPKLDYEVKISGYNRFVKEFISVKENPNKIEEYYNKFETLRGGAMRERFTEFYNRRKIEEASSEGGVLTGKVHLFHKNVYHRKDSSRVDNPAHGKFGAPVAWFATKQNMAMGWTLYKLDKSDLAWFKSQNVSTENVFRSFTVSGHQGLIKVDLSKGMVYFFNNEKYEETDKIVFETKGVKFDRFFIEEGFSDLF